MNFFEQQDLAHRNTKRLIILLCLAVISLVAITTFLFAMAFYLTNSKHHTPTLHEPGFWQGITHAMSINMFLGISLTVCGVIFLGSLYKLFQFSSGGRAVAEAMGGRLINLSTANANEQKILNVVEEMAIASGTPVPPVYMLDDDAINAFAAGYTPQDAVIGITRGCVQLLNRDELQGVIAHEFSHIFHGDMKLNMRLVALLNGILLLGLIGEFLVRNTNHRIPLSSDRNKSPIAIIGIGIGLIIIGYAGTFFGNLIKSAVSRQREFLADASAVKFTRNPDGIGGALKKIGGYPQGSQLQNSNASEFSHMYFSEGISNSFSQWMETHPPLEERIKRIEPYWDGSYPILDTQKYKNDIYEHQRPAISQPTLEPIEFFSTEKVLETIAEPTTTHLLYAQQTIHAIDEAIHTSAHNTWDAQALMLGLLLDKNSEQQEHQWKSLTSIFNTAEIATLKKTAAATHSLEAALRLPVIELSLPTLKQLSPSQYQRFKQAITAFIQADDRVNLLEWSFYRILVHNLEPRTAPKRLADLSQLYKEAHVLLSAIAYAGTHSAEEATKSFNDNKTLIELNETEILLQSDYTLIDLNQAVTSLRNLKPLQKPRLLKALSQCVLHDGTITTDEAELFRAIADSLDCPIPPFLSNRK